MIFKKIKKLIPAIFGALVLMTMSSCNRGMGCPMDFSIADAFNQFLLIVNQFIQ